MLLLLPCILYVLIGGNGKGFRLASKSSRTRLLAHSLKFTIYGISSGEKFWAVEILDCVFIYTSRIGIVSLFGFGLLDCPMGYTR